MQTYTAHLGDMYHCGTFCRQASNCARGRHNVPPTWAQFVASDKLCRGDKMCRNRRHQSSSLKICSFVSTQKGMWKPDVLSSTVKKRIFRTPMHKGRFMVRRLFYFTKNVTIEDDNSRNWQVCLSASDWRRAMAVTPNQSCQSAILLIYSFDRSYEIYEC